ncbi:MAG: hypothetical protein LPK21_07355, partial [Hymenobacteraceae bacterium]|nr:hypothetical protein [Hymenobacteraceae bacterium]
MKDYKQMAIKNLMKKLVTLIKLFLSKVIVFLVKKLNTLDIVFTDYAFNPNQTKYEDLTPVVNADEDGTYSNAILWALKNRNITNIAITGPYGSGKSSILKSFECNNKQFYFLNISLASFDETQEKQRNTDIYERQLIELSILQQIFYSVSDKSIPDSRFKRIRSYSFFNLLIK